jgi:hypothetical protein
MGTTRRDEVAAALWISGRGGEDWTM